MKADSSPQRERRSLPGPDVDWRPLAKTLYEEKRRRCRYMIRCDMIRLTLQHCNICILHFLLTGSLLGRDRLSHTVGVLGDDSHQVVGSRPQFSCGKDPLTGRDRLLQGEREVIFVKIQA